MKDSSNLQGFVPEKTGGTKSIFARGTRLWASIKMWVVGSSKLAGNDDCGYAGSIVAQVRPRLLGVPKHPLGTEGNCKRLWTFCGRYGIFLPTEVYAKVTRGQINFRLLLVNWLMKMFHATLGYERF